MAPTVSLYLDLLRIVAALAVAYGHFSLPLFSEGWKNLSNVGVAFVGVFFVLSGYVIRYIVDQREADLLSYSVARLARLYSVLVPALLFSAVVALATNYLDQNYAANWENGSSYPVLRIIACLVFMNQNYGLDVIPLMNYPVWSLGYEAPYYIVFGIYWFLRGWFRVTLLVLVLLIYGPNIFVLFVPWVVGAWLFGFLKGRHISPLAGALCLACAVLVAALYPIYVSPNVNKIREYSMPVSFIWQGRSESFTVFYAVTIITAMSICAVQAYQGVVGAILVPLARPIRAAASATFTLYLFHFPMFVLIYVLTGYDRSSLVAKCAALVTGIGTCFLLSKVIESRKSLWAKWIRSVLMWRRLSSQNVARAP